MSLSHRVDHFNGVLIDADAVPSNVDVFRTQLAASVQEWIRDGRRGVWLRLTAAHAAAGHVAVACAMQFTFHSVRAGSMQLQLTRWLPQDGPSTLPAGPHTSVGVGAFVIAPGNRQEVLLVKEKVGVPFFKLPTGLLEAGEEIDDAARREVLEETGVLTDAKFCRLAALRSQHGPLNLTGEPSNLFVVVVLRATSTAIRVQESELQDARWFTFAQFAQMTEKARGGVYGALNEAALHVAQTLDDGLDAHDLPLVFVPAATNRVFLPARKPARRNSASL
jgi:ADP-ribose pyrophosphatase YjhB (NUDIX family)